MLQRISLSMASFAICLFCICCHKNNAPTLAGTSWECLEDGNLLVFNDRDSGFYYCKSATDDILDDVYSIFDFEYRLSEDNSIIINIALSRRNYSLSGTIDDNTMTLGAFHFVHIPHKVPE